MKTIYALIICVISFSGFSQIKDGDIIFIKNKETKGKDLLPNGKSKFNYVGVIFIENGTPVVYHSTQPLTKSPIKDFIKLSINEDYAIKHLIEEELLTPDAISIMHTFALAKVGSSYDNKLNLDNEELYNAEFVWKIYKSGIGLPLSAPKELKEYKIENAVNNEFLTDSYGIGILNEKIVIVGDIYQSQFLEE